MNIESLKSHELEPQTDKHTVNGMDLWKGQTNGEGPLLKKRRQEANHYIAAYEYHRLQKKARFQENILLHQENREHLEEQRSKESLANNQRKWQRTEGDLNDNQRKWLRTEGDLISDQRRWLRRGKLSDKQINRWLQDCGTWAQEKDNEAKLSNKSNLEGVKDGKENADSTTSKTPSSHLKNHNQSDPFFDGISNQQADSTASKGRSFFPDIKTGTNSQSHVDQATGYKESEFIRGFNQNGSKSTGPDATTPFDAQKSTDQQSAKAAQTFYSTDDLYKDPKVLELKRAIYETNEGKGISEEENKYAKTFQEFLREVRIDREKAVNPLQKVIKMQKGIEQHQLELLNAFDPKLVGQDQKRKYKSCAEGLKEKFEEATDYMEREIRYAKSKTQNPSSMSQWSTVVPPIPVGVY
jgi:hypothetical protein